MRKLVYYVASSLDGFIAGEDGGTDAFPVSEPYLLRIAADLPETLPVHARAALGVDAPPARFDTVLMGRATYQPALDAGIASPYAPLRQIVFSRLLPPSDDPSVKVLSGDPVPVVRRLKAEDTGRDVWLCGGGDLAAQLADEIDELIVKLNPVVLGRGVPMFRGRTGPRPFALVRSEAREAGVLWLHYAPLPG